MDFLKTLMLYMSLTFATAVQGAEPPVETAVPTFTPAPAVVETLPGETAGPIVITAAPTVTANDPSATATPAPLPTITPNTGYKNLQMNSRGDQVKRLQERLIELGYLNGDADGAFGRQTYNAVIAFQKANGLTADGVAGDATQTIIFESPDVIAREVQATSTPVLTFTPAPSVSPEPEAELPGLDEIPAAADEASAAAEASAPTAAPTAEPEPAGPTLLHGVSIVLNDSGEKLTCLRQEDGVTIRATPRVWQTEEDGLLLDMTDLAASAEGWSFTLSMGGAYTFMAEGYTVTITPSDDGFLCQADGEDVVLEEGDFLLEGDTVLCSPALLEKALGAETLWDSEEQTLMIRLMPRELAEASD